VSLSGYEELQADEEAEDKALSQSHGNASTYATSTSQPGDDTVHADAEGHEDYDHTDDSLLDHPDISGSTPRPPRTKIDMNGKPKFADYPSPYEALKRELKGGNTAAEGEEDMMGLPPTTPGPEQRLPDMSMTPMSSPFAPTSQLLSTTQRKGADPLLHRVLDKNYRLQATPHTTRKEARTPAAKPSWRDTTSPMSSPPAAAPQLRSEIFSSPVRQQYGRATAPRTPGVSIQPPAKGKAKVVKDEITWESDSDQDADDVYKELGMSPPKTIQFAIPPSRLMQTPGKFIYLLNE
jgi:DASH complex subunit ASK1